MADLVMHSRTEQAAPDVEEAYVTRSSLPGLVADEIMPQLLRAHGIASPSGIAASGSTVSTLDVEYICQLIARSDARALSRAVTALHQRGVSADDMMLDLLPKAAHFFGRLWEADQCDFASLTIGMGRLQQMRREIEALPHPELIVLGPRRRALLAPAPGEQHNFGVMIVDHFFHHAGWRVNTLAAGEADAISSLACREFFEIAGLSLSCEAYLLPLEKLIATLRRTSRNRRIGIIVGGLVFRERPELAILIGADAAGVDGRDAVRQAERIAAGIERLETTE